MVALITNLEIPDTMSLKHPMLTKEHILELSQT